MLRTAVASGPLPQEFVARAEYTRLVVEPMIVEPANGRFAPTPGIATLAAGSDACQLSVTDSPGQTLPRESWRVTLGSGQACRGFVPTTARRRAGGVAGASGAKSIDVIG